MGDLGAKLREAREAAGLSLAGMARRTGYSRSYLGNVETGVRDVTPGLIRAYQRALGEDLDRRSLLVGAASFVAGGLPVPDVAVDIARDVTEERSRLLATVQTSHEVDLTIARLIAKDAPSVASLVKWTRGGPPVLRVNAAGILAKLGSPVLDNEVVAHLRADAEARDLYLSAVVRRVLGVPWPEAGPMAGHVDRLAVEVLNPNDCGARWCSIVLLAAARPDARQQVDAALSAALRTETSRENLRAIGGALAGLHPVQV